MIDYLFSFRLEFNFPSLGFNILVHLFCFIINIFLQGANALFLFGGCFTNPELCRLASCLPLRTLGAKAYFTTDRYSRAFEKFRLWASDYNEISVLPSNALSVATYLESLLQAVNLSQKEENET